MLKRMAKKKKLLLAATVMGIFSGVSVNSWSVVAAADSDTAKTRDVVVTASRTEQEVKETPAAVEVITREDLDKIGAESLAQALKQAIGIDVSENGMIGNSVSIRGAKSNQTLILVDGMRIRTENTDQTANNYELQRINMSDVERIEIVRGAVSSLYGADAMGGVINIITKTPDKAATSLFADYTTKQADYGFRLATGWQGKWASSISYKRSDVHHIDVHGSSGQYGTKDYISFKTKYQIEKNKTLSFFTDYMNEDLYLKSDFTSYDHDRTKLGLSYDGKDRLGKYQLRVNYTIFDKDQNTREDGTLTGWDKMKFQTLTFDGQRSMALNDNNLLTFGGEIRQEKYEGTRLGAGGDNAHTVYRDGVSNDYSDKDNTYTALFVQDEWTVNDSWLMIPSLRYDHNEAFGDKVTYKLGNTYKMSKNSRLKLNVGTAYRAPTEAELYMNWHHTPVSLPTMKMNVYVKGNPNLRPETSFNVDFGLEAENNHGMTGKLTYFYNKFDDLITGVSTTNRSFGTSGIVIDVISQYTNVSKAEIQGIEAEMKQKLGNNWTWRNTYTYTDAVDGNGVRLEGRDRHKVSVQLHYDDKKTGWSGSLWNDWHVGYWATDGNSNLTNNTTTVLNFVVSKKISKGGNAYFGVDNILNRDSVNDYTVFGLTGRVWRTGLNWNF